MLNIIASVGKNNELGKNGNLIWHIREDLIFFRNMTINHDIIMGRKTFESLPRLLDKRNHIVLTKGNIDNKDVETVQDIKILIMRYKDKDAFIIGGSSIYQQFLEYALNIYLTEIDSICTEADTFFPEFNKENYKRKVLRIDYDDKLKIGYSHVLYKKKERL